MILNTGNNLVEQLEADGGLESEADQGARSNCGDSEICSRVKDFKARDRHDCADRNGGFGLDSTRRSSPLQRLCQRRAGAAAAAAQTLRRDGLSIRDVPIAHLCRRSARRVDCKSQTLINNEAIPVEAKRSPAK
ncbi:MAG TPA: hypothetical protein VII45_04360 [Solirubrobacterales bacterium]